MAWNPILYIKRSLGNMANGYVTDRNGGGGGKAATTITPQPPPLRPGKSNLIHSECPGNQILSGNLILKHQEVESDTRLRVYARLHLSMLSRL